MINEVKVLRFSLGKFLPLENIQRKFSNYQKKVKNGVLFANGKHLILFNFYLIGNKI